MLRLWLWMGWGTLLIATSADAQSAWRDALARPRACVVDPERVAAELNVSGRDAYRAPFFPLTSPEASVYALALAVARESLDLYDVVRHESFVFVDPRRDFRLDYTGDHERMGRLFARFDVAEVSITIERSAPSEHPDYPATSGHVQVRACWHRVGFEEFFGLRNEASLFVLVPVELPDASPLWRIVYWESPERERPSKPASPQTAGSF